MDKTSKRVILEDGTALTIPDSLKAKMGSLKSGTMVKATYEDMGGDKVATSLEVQPSAQKPRS